MAPVALKPPRPKVTGNNSPSAAASDLNSVVHRKEVIPEFSPPGLLTNTVTVFCAFTVTVVVTDSSPAVGNSFKMVFGGLFKDEASRVM